MNFDESLKFLEKSKTLIPGLTQTFSRAAPTFVQGCYPVYAKSANGSHFFDVDGNEFIDYLMALGPITLGYNYPLVNQAVIDQLKNGVIFSLPHPIEIQVSELISEIIPNAEMVKFEKTGSNAVTGAIRAARALTKREKIAYCGSGGVWQKCTTCDGKGTKQIMTGNNFFRNIHTVNCDRCSGRGKLPLSLCWKCNGNTNRICII